MDRPRVLIVDPHLEAQAFIQKTLARYCDLILYADPLDVLDAIEVFEPDLLITELELPALSGFELINLLQREEAFRALPIMVFSSQGAVENQKQAYRLGAMHFQVKPCSLSQLFKAAAMFVRLTDLEKRQPKQHSMERVRALLAERAAHGQRHSLMRAALNHQNHQNHSELNEARSIMASIAARRPAA